MNKKEYINTYGLEKYLKKLEYYRTWYNKHVKKEKNTPTLQEKRENEIKSNEETTLQFVKNYKGRWVIYQDCVILDNGEIYRRGGLHNCCTNKDKKVFKKFKIVKQSEQKKTGYLTCVVGCKQDYVHRHIWKAFNGEIPEGLQIDHIDTDRSNNSLSNLRLVTMDDNIHNSLTLKHLDYSNKIKGLELIIKNLKKENEKLKQLLYK